MTQTTSHYIIIKADMSESFLQLVFIHPKVAGELIIGGFNQNHFY